MNQNFTGLFTYEEAEKAFKDFKQSCHKDEDCPEYVGCPNSYCKFTFYCKINDLTQCGTKNYTNAQNLIGCQSNNDCFSNICENNKCIGKPIQCEIGNGIAKYGLGIGEKCTKNEDCFLRNCVKGICENSSNKGMGGVISEVVISCIILAIILIIFCWFGCFKIKRRMAKKERI